MINKRFIIAVLVLLFAVLQYELWISDDGLTKTIELRHSIRQQMKQNKKIIKQNDELTHQIMQLKKGKGTVESLAREEVGMIKPGETYYQF